MGRKELHNRTRKWQRYSLASGVGKENIVCVILKMHLKTQPDYEITPKPKTLKHIYTKSRGIIPELSIRYIPTGNTIFIEVKRQGDEGNAHERLCKYFAPGILSRSSVIANINNPFFFVLMDGLAKNARYDEELRIWFDADNFRDRYLLWTDTSDDTKLTNWFDVIIKPYLEKGVANV